LQRIAKFAVGSGGEEKDEQEERERGVCGIGCVQPFFSGELVQNCTQKNLNEKYSFLHS
jgi:hypothetical protein